MSGTDLARIAASRYRERAEARWRRMPNMRVLPATGAPTVYYLTTHGSTPQGGVRVSYRHVDVLNEIGIKAAVLHLTRGFRPTWFESSTPVVSEETIRFRENDILVVVTQAPGRQSLGGDARGHRRMLARPPGRGVPGRPLPGSRGRPVGTRRGRA